MVLCCIRRGKYMWFAECLGWIRQYYTALYGHVPG